jgi:hypothetical protein
LVLHQKEIDWIIELFRTDRKQATHPLEHILVQILLERTRIVTSSHPFGLGPWKCPNPYGEHDKNLPIIKIVKKTNRAKEAIACARCSCGFFFSFNKMDKKDKHLPVIKGISIYGPTWKIKAESLLISGMSVQEIAATMSISVRLVNRLLAFKSKRRNSPPRDIETARNEWLQKLEQTPNGLITIARIKNCSLYRFLRKYDHEWMMSQIKPRKKRVDIEERDAVWSQLLEAAALSIASNYPSRRIAKTVMIKVAGLNLRLMAELDNFPKCKSVIDRLSESCVIYQRRGGR